MASTLLLLLSMCAIGYSVRQDYLWTVTLTVSEVAGGEYEGEVELLAVFKDHTQHSTVLPSTKYRLGQAYTFPVRMTSSSPLDALYIRTKGLCPLGLLPIDLLRLRRVELVSKTTNTAHTKQVDDLAIKDSCQVGSQGTALTDFSSSDATFCHLDDGQRYESGDKFDIGCSGRCQCVNGSIACVSMCPPVAWGPDQKCHYVRTPGECCEQVLCEDQDDTQTCQEAKPGKVATEDNKAVRRYPWSVLYCTNENCTSIHGGIIVGEK